MLPVRQIESFTNEMEKQAILGTLAIGAGLHVGANAGFKALRSSSLGHQMEQSQIASGFNHALKKQQINPVLKNVATYGVGPESLLHYGMGQRLGSQMSEMSKGRRYRELKKMRKNFAMSPELRSAPGGKAMIGAIDKIILPQPKPGLLSRAAAKIFPTVAKGSKPTLGHQLVSGALGTAAVAAEPHAAIHLGINGLRRTIATSDMGKRFLRKQFTRGASGASAPGRLAQNITDLAVSPAALDTRRMGSAIHSAMNAGGSKRAIKSLAGSVMAMPTIRRFASEKAKSVGQRLARAL